MSNYGIKRPFLSSISYSFTMPDKDLINITVNDLISAKRISKERYLCLVTRLLDFGEGTDSSISVEYRVTIELDDDYTDHSIDEILKSDKYQKLNPIFAKISFLISELTNASPFGVIVTPPMCREPNVSYD